MNSIRARELELNGILSSLEHIRDEFVGSLRPDGISRSSVLTEISEQAGMILYDLKRMTIYANEQSDPSSAIDNTVLTDLQHLQLYTRRLTYLRLQEGKSLTDIELVKNLEQGTIWESLVHYTLDEAIHKLSQHQTDQPPPISHPFESARQFLIDAQTGLLPEVVIPPLSSLDDCYDDIIMCKSILRNWQRSVKSEDELIIRRIDGLIRDPSHSKAERITSVYDLIELTCRLLDYVRSKARWILTHTEELRQDYRAIHWTVELKMGLDEISAELSLVQIVSRGESGL